MNTEEAKLILASVHQGTDIDSDTEQAFSLLDSDPGLREWLEQERAFDDAVSDKLAQIEPPATLKAMLIGLLEEHAPVAPPSSGKGLTWFRPPILAAAAAVILIPLIAIQMFTGRANATSFENFRSDMVEFAASEFKLDHHEKDLPKIYTWLNANNATSPSTLPDCVDCKQSVGCKIIEWNNQRVTLICLRNGDDQVVHCFVVPRDEFAKLPDEQQIRNKLKVDQLETCGWTDPDNLYLLVGSTKAVRVKAPKA
jgi:hypothetical protein